MSKPHFEIAESATFPGTWNWGLWEDVDAGPARRCVACVHGLLNRADAVASVRRFRKLLREGEIKHAATRRKAS